MSETLQSVLTVPEDWWQGRKMVSYTGRMSLHGAIDRVTPGGSPIERWERGKSLRQMAIEAIKLYGYDRRINRVGDLIGEFNDHSSTTFDEIRKVAVYVDNAFFRANRPGKVG